MEHGHSWFSLVPGVQELQVFFRSQGEGILFHNPIVVQHVVAAIFVAIVVLLVAGKAGADVRRADDKGVVPDDRVSLRNILEVVLEAVYNQMRQIIGKEAARYFPVIATLTLFIFFSNILGLIPGFLPPTDNWNTTMGCGIFVFLYYNYHGIRVQGAWGHFKHLANPADEWWGWFLMPLMLPLEIVSNLARPFSLGVRLAANMVGDHAVLGAFLGLLPPLIPIAFLGLGLLVCVVQTLVFVVLSIIYIALVTADTHHDDAHGHGAEAAAH